MKIAVTASGRTLDDHVDPRFGRCPCFLLVDTDTMAVSAVENPNLALGGGAGIQSAQLMAEHEVQAVLTGNCGPNAHRTLEAAGIRVVVGASGTVREAVEKLRDGALSPADGPNVASHFGTGGGRARNPEPTPQRTATPRLVAAVDTKECTGCGRCLDACPAEAITVHTVALIDVAACRGCGECVIECPQDAIVLRKI